MKLLLFATVLLYSHAALGDTYFFRVARNGSPVGHGIISIERSSEETVVRYRMNIVVRVLRIPVYRLDSQQLAVFDAEGRLRTARTKANIDGTEHEVRVSHEGHTFTLIHNGERTSVPQEKFASTTLNPVFGRPGSGTWLDLTDGTLVPYQVTALAENRFELIRPDGRDVLTLDSEGVIEKIHSFIKRGSLEMTRIDVAPGTPPPVTLPPLLEER